MVSSFILALCGWHQRARWSQQGGGGRLCSPTSAIRTAMHTHALSQTTSVAWTQMEVNEWWARGSVSACVFLVCFFLLSELLRKISFFLWAIEIIPERVLVMTLTYRICGIWTVYNQCKWTEKLFDMFTNYGEKWLLITALSEHPYRVFAWPSSTCLALPSPMHLGMKIPYH